MSETATQEPKGLAVVPVDLSEMLSHVAAPNWFLCAHGHQGVHKHPLLCPVCGMEETRISTVDEQNDAFLIRRNGTGNMDVPCGKGNPRRAAGCTGFTSVSIPMECSKGHGWLLDVGQFEDGDGHCGISVNLDEREYDGLYPAEKEKWD